MLINSSLDILWLAIALVVLWIGIWLGFAAFYFAMSIKDGRHILSSIKRKFEFVDGVLSIFKRKKDKDGNVASEGVAAIIPPLVEGVTKLTEAFQEGKKMKDKKSKGKK